MCVSGGERDALLVVLFGACVHVHRSVRQCVRACVRARVHALVFSR